VKTIYALIDPRTSDVRYIGATTDVQRRLQEHLRREEARHCSRWIRSLLASGLSPRVWVFEVVGDGWQAAERRWIQTFRDLGMATCNIADGGEGTSPGSTKLAETRAKMSVAATRWQTGRKLPAEQRERMSTAQLKRYEDPNQRAFQAENLASVCASGGRAGKGKPKSPEHVEKIKQSRRARRAAMEEQMNANAEMSV
jgi:hypothetical protein